MKRHSFRLIGLVVAALLLVFAISTGCDPKKDNTSSTGVIPEMNTPVEKGTTIEINTSTDPTKNPSPLKCPLSQGQQPDQDHVRWHNISGHPVTLTFTAWPFMEPAGPIVIKDGEYSPYFSLDKTLPTGPYTYHASPPFPTGGPGEPSIEDGP